MLGIIACNLPQLHSGIVLIHSTKLASQTYNLTSASLDQPAITVKGDHITIDFSGATLRGTSEDTPPDQRQGLALLIEGNDVTVKNANIRGYKLAILSKSCNHLHLVNCDWSYNWKQHLKSTIEKENEDDWMSFHHNEHDEWIYGTKDDPAYGAGGAYLTGCEGFEVSKCRATGGQCGLMLNRSNHGKVWGNDFSYLSAVGIGLYRSSDNQITQNSIDYCVRGYSHGVYSRGQDSTGILIYEQSNRNVFAYNSVTHGGDGFFLWAGQTTMDTGEGGCNDNMVYGNDFSFSPANGIEATFSRNTFVNNKLVECWHGVWGGFSYDSKFLGNVFAYDGQAVAIEHGQNNLVNANTMQRCDQGVVLWANPITDATWGYPKHHDSDSHGYKIDHNLMADFPGAPISLANTSDVEILGNSMKNCPEVKIGKNVTGLNSRGNKVEHRNVSSSLHPYMTYAGNNVLVEETSDFRVAWNPLQPEIDGAELKSEYAPKGAKPLSGHAYWPVHHEAGLGRRYILVDEWGPYDFRRPLLWPRGTDGKVAHYEILGPRGTWSVAKLPDGAKAAAESGHVPGHLDVTFADRPPKQDTLELIYNGRQITDEYGRVRSGHNYRFDLPR